MAILSTCTSQELLKDWVWPLHVNWQLEGLTSPSSPVGNLSWTRPSKRSKCAEASQRTNRCTRNSLTITRTSLPQSYCRTGSQRVNSISADLSQASSSDQAFQRATDEFGQGKAPDVVVCAAGMAGGLLGLFADDLQPDQLERAMSVNYFTAAYTAMVRLDMLLLYFVCGRDRLTENTTSENRLQPNV